MQQVILFIQVENDVKTRTYRFCPNVTECMATVWGIFQVMTMNEHYHGPPTLHNVGQLEEFINKLPDLACLVYREDLGGYEPKNKNWIIAQFVQLFEAQQGYRWNPDL
ncbi:enhancer of rudimentary homolog [Anopheles marshallii]|uniref:enhancer of rudimentary homolog n=1 Tax=Anopheles marshallii TaxID=1521116 RepID=UPI00237A88FD|nr:enhancer of rudimentary homolog [Anopheles marshallii]